MANLVKSTQTLGIYDVVVYTHSNRYISLGYMMGVIANQTQIRILPAHLFSASRDKLAQTFGKVFLIIVSAIKICSSCY